MKSRLYALTVALSVCVVHAQDARPKLVPNPLGDTTGQTPSVLNTHTSGAPSRTSAAAADKRALPSPKVDEVSVEEQAVQSISPMSADEIHRFSGEVYNRSRAETAVPGGPYEPRNRLVRVNLAPGTPPTTIQIAMNFGASVQLVDQLGQPLILDAVQLYSPAARAAVPPTPRVKREGTSVFSLEAQALTGQATGTIQLRDFPGVVIPLLVQVGQSPSVDANVQLMIPVTAPRAQPVPGDRFSGDGVVPDEMLAFLNNLPPQEALEAPVQGVQQTQAWYYRGSVYLRTRMPVLSPAWLRRYESSDGTLVYQLPPAPLVKVSVAGRSVDCVLSLPVIPPLAAKANAS